MARTEKIQSISDWDIAPQPSVSKLCVAIAEEYNKSNPDNQINMDRLQLVIDQSEVQGDPDSLTFETWYDGYTAVKPSEDLPLLSIKTSIIDSFPEIPRQDKPTFVLIGGATSSRAALRVMGTFLSVLEPCTVVFAPHAVNKDTVHPDNDLKEFRKLQKQFDQEEGPFALEGKYIDGLVKKLKEGLYIGDNVTGVGLSTGGLVMMQASKKRGENDSALNKLMLLDSGGLVSTKTMRSRRSRFTKVFKTALGFLSETLKSLGDRNEWLMQMKDAGRSGYSYFDMAKLPKRLTTSLLQEIHESLPRTTVIHGENDTIFGVEEVEKMIEEIAASNVSLLTIPGGEHSTVTQDPIFIAELITRAWYGHSLK